MNQPFLRRSTRILIPSIHNNNVHRQIGSSLLLLDRLSLPHQYRPLSSSTQRHDDNPPTSRTAANLTSSLLELSKARLSLLVVTTTSLGFLSAGPSLLLTQPATLLAVSTGTALCSASAATLNQVIETPRDILMKRTRNRPLLPQSNGRPAALSKEEGLAWAAFTGGSGASILMACTDPLTTLLGVGNIALYAGVYTYMKPKTEWNTWVGAIVGAVPPVMGYTAATGGCVLEAEPILLGSTLFLWQFPHFMALNWMYREDYKRGGFNMISTSDPTGSRTSTFITRYTLYLSTLPILSSLMEVTSPMFAIEGIALNAYAIYVARRFHKDKSNANARKVFLTSLWYLPCFLMLFLLHSRKWHSDKEEDSINSSNNDGALLDWISKIQGAGREACLHELIVQKNLWVQFASSSSSDDREEKIELDESKCPVALVKGSVAAAEKKSRDVIDADTSREDGSV